MAESENRVSSYLNWLIHSIDTPSYFQFRKIPIRLIFVYAAVTVLLASGIVSMVTAVRSYQQLGEMAVIYREHFPPMEIADGKLVVSGTEPFIYSGEDIQVIVDISGKTTRLDALYSKGVIFQESQIILFNEGFEPREMPYSYYTAYSVGDPVVDGESLLQYRGSIAVGMLIFWGMLFLLRWVISKAMYVVIASFLVGMISEMHRVMLARNHRLIIAITAVIPIIFLETIETLIQSSDLISLLFLSESPIFIIVNLIVYGLLIILGTRAYIAPFIQHNPQE